MMRFGKKAFELDVLGWIIIGVLTLAVVAISVFILIGKGNSAIDFIKDLFKFGG